MIETTRPELVAYQEERLAKFVNENQKLDKGQIVLRFKTQGVCSREISFEVKDNKLTNVQFVGGCSGNTQGLSRLIEGMDVDEAIRRLDGIQCGPRPTSCPDQLARALKQFKGR